MCHTEVHQGQSRSRAGVWVCLHLIMQFNSHCPGVSYAWEPVCGACVCTCVRAYMCVPFAVSLHLLMGPSGLHAAIPHFLLDTSPSIPCFIPCSLVMVMAPALSSPSTLHSFSPWLPSPPRFHAPFSSSAPLPCATPLHPTPLSFRLRMICVSFMCWIKRAARLSRLSPRLRMRQDW